jgi:hypothetical protein
MRTAVRSLVCLLLALAPLGCRSVSNLFGPPGTMRQQQLGATMHDPYADNDAGPAVVGGRPRDFQKPLAEPVRSRLLTDSTMPR